MNNTIIIEIMHGLPQRVKFCVWFILCYSLIFGVVVQNHPLFPSYYQNKTVFLHPFL